MDNAKDLAYQDYLAGMKYKEIAEKYGVKEGTVRSWANRHWKQTVAEIPLQQTAKNVAAEDETLQHSQGDSWVSIETEYVTDISRKPCNLKDLADKYDINYDYLRRYAAAHNWNGKRKNNITITSQKTAELINEDHAKINARHFKLSGKALNKIEEALSNEDELYKYVEVLREGSGKGVFSDILAVETLSAINDKKLLNIVTALEKLQKMQRTTSGLLTPAEAHKIDYDNARLELERRKAEADNEANKPIEITIKRAEKNEPENK